MKCQQLFDNVITFSEFMLKRLLNQIIDKILSKRIEQSVEYALLHKHRVFGEKSRLTIASSAQVNNALFNTNSGSIFIEEGVFFGHSVSVLTGTHNTDVVGQRRQAFPQSGHDIVIKKGAWIASNVTILGPCVIGEDAVVAACSLVKNDVPPKTIVAGVPARFLREINIYDKTL